MFPFIDMGLDVKDKKILQELDANPRIPLSRLAKKVRLSQQVVDYRVKRLEEQGIIQHFGTIFNLSKIRYEQYRVFLQLGNVDDAEKKKIIGYLQRHEQVYWAALIGSKWDLFVVVFVRNYEALEEFLDGMFQKFPKALRDYEALYVLYHEFYPHKFLGMRDSFKPLKVNSAVAGKYLALDKTDLQILHVLKIHCRASSLEIAKTCKVSYKTVQNRIKKLEAEDMIIGYRMFLRSEAFHYKAYLLVFSFTSYGKKIEENFLRYVQQKQEITQALKLFGRYSFMLHFRVRNEKELHHVIVDLRNRFPALGDYEIIPIFEDIAIDHFPMSGKLISGRIHLSA